MFIAPYGRLVHVVASIKIDGLLAARQGSAVPLVAGKGVEQ